MNSQIAPIFTNIHELRSGFERAYSSAANTRMVYFNFDLDIHGNYREKAILAAFKEFTFGYASGQGGHGLHVKISHENVDFSVVANELIREMLSAGFEMA